MTEIDPNLRPEPDRARRATDGEMIRLGAAIRPRTLILILSGLGILGGVGTLKAFRNDAAVDQVQDELGAAYTVTRKKVDATARVTVTQVAECVTRAEFEAEQKRVNDIIASLPPARRRGFKPSPDPKPTPAPPPVSPAVTAPLPPTPAAAAAAAPPGGQ